MKVNKAIIELAKVAKADNKYGFKLYYSSQKRDGYFYSKISTYLSDGTQISIPVDIMSNQEFDYVLPDNFKKIAEKIDLTYATFELIDSHLYEVLDAKYDNENRESYYRINQYVVNHPLRITTHNGEYHLNGSLPENDKDSIDRKESYGIVENLTITKDIYQAIVNAKGYVGDDPKKPQLTFVHVFFEKDKVIVSASNGHILYRQTFEQENDVETDIVFSDYVIKLLESWFKKQWEINIYADMDIVSYSADYDIVVKRNLSYSHQPLKTIDIDTKNSTKVSFDLKNLSTALKQLGKERKSFDYRVTIKDNTATIENLGNENKVKIEIDATAEKDISFGINSFYLSTLLKTETEKYFDCLVTDKALVKISDNLYKLVMFIQIKD